MSDRELQFKKFKLECNTLCKAASAAFNDYAASSNTNNPTSCLDLASEGLSHIATTLCTLSSDIGKSYRSFPLLCSRTPQRFNETSTETVGESVTVTKDEEKSSTDEGANTAINERNCNDTTTPGTVQKEKPAKKKKKKKKSMPLPAWKRELQERRGLRKSTEVSTGETKNQDSESGDNVCRRTVAVSYNKKTNSVRWGVSGQLKNQKIHKSIWGKSLIKGRPRGTCAEFHVINESLLADEGVEDMFMHVSDLIEGSNKPRCRNCLYISSNAHCFSDDLIFDGKTDKQSKFEWKGSLKFKEMSK
jgi:hypothetical protein